VFFDARAPGGGAMSPTTRTTPTVDISAAPRAVIATAADLIYRVGRSVLGDERVPTAQGNAWAAVCADRKRASERAEVMRWLETSVGEHR
jgi:hypothetical protein